MKAKRKVQIFHRSGRLRRPEVSEVMKAVHVAPRGGRWVVVKAGPKRTRSVFETKDAALSFARSLAEPKASVLVHGIDGRLLRDPASASPAAEAGT
ncbi:MAG: DUF2188 domain-containing protein [Acidobacteria bacterium]|nr:DUF2188 domain-containing protein [Acidobacteriota bacterium]